jgi:hypothetical protein
MLAAVNPRNTGWEGGSKTVAGTPVNVGGSLSSPGAPGFTAPGIPAIATARNNSGSNIRIPYARTPPHPTPHAHIHSSIS